MEQESTIVDICRPHNQQKISALVDRQCKWDSVVLLLGHWNVNLIVV